MLNFLQFLEEAKIPRSERSPDETVRLVQRYAQRDMARNHPPPVHTPREEDISNLHIRTKGYNPKFVDKAMEALDKREDEIMGKVDFGSAEQAKAGRQRVRDSEVIRRVSVKSLLPSQEFVAVGDPKMLRDKITASPKTVDDKKNYPRVIGYRGRKVIVDRHHLLAGKIAKGAKRVRVSFLDLDGTQPPIRKRKNVQRSAQNNTNPFI